MTATPGNILNSPFPYYFRYGGITKYTTTTMTMTMEVPNYLEEASDPSTCALSKLSLLSQEQEKLLSSILSIIKGRSTQRNIQRNCSKMASSSVQTYHDRHAFRRIMTDTPTNIHNRHDKHAYYIFNVPFSITTYVHYYFLSSLYFLNSFSIIHPSSSYIHSYENIISSYYYINFVNPLLS